MKIEKSERREQKRKKERLGMQVRGRSVTLLLRAQEKRDKERAKKRGSG